MKPGKKVGTLAVYLKAEAQRRNFAHVDVELRLDGRGSFHAHYEGKWYSAATQADLHEKLRVAIEKTADVEWTRYLIIHYQAEAWPTDGDSGRPLTSGQYESFGIGDDRAELAADPSADAWANRRYERVLTSIDLRWEIIEFSSPYVPPQAKTKMVRMSRDVEMRSVVSDDVKHDRRGRVIKGEVSFEEHVCDPVERDDDKLPAGAVLWTAEREAFLREILAAFATLDARMVELFRGDPAQLAGKIDAAVPPSRMLAAPAEVAPPSVVIEIDADRDELARDAVATRGAKLRRRQS